MKTYRVVDKVTKRGGPEEGVCTYAAMGVPICNNPGRRYDRSTGPDQPEYTFVCNDHVDYSDGYFAWWVKIT